jgi:hypothetical protein
MIEPLPTGLQSLVSMAAADPRFADALIADRDAAVAASGLTLTPAERAVLRALPPSALRALAAGVSKNLPESSRRAFLARVGPALVTLGLASVLPASARATPDDEAAASGWLLTGTDLHLEDRRSGYPPPAAVRPPVRTRLGRIEVGPTHCAHEPSRKAAEIVARTLARGRLMDCYFAGLKRNPKLGGSLEVVLDIARAGRVRRLRKAVDRLGDKAVVACVVQKLGATRWNDVRPGEKIRQSFRFVPEPTAHPDDL